MDCKDFYLGVHDNIHENIKTSLSSEYYQQIASANAFIDDYLLWETWISKSYGSEIFKLAESEYEASILFCLESLYKQAFTALRACLEHTLFGIQLTTNLFQYLQWKNNSKDVYWSEITNTDSGLFSYNYFSIFAPEMWTLSQLMLELAKRVYRECSEFTHGNYRIFGSLNKTIFYEDSLIKQFFELLGSVKYIIEFSFFVRFNKELGQEDIPAFEPQITEYLGHLREVVDYLSFHNEG